MTAEPMDPGPLIMRWLDELAECSEDPAELTRRYLTPEHREAAGPRHAADAGSGA